MFINNFIDPAKIYMILQVPTGLYLGFECNLFCANALIWASGDNLGPKHPANSCKWVAFAAAVQGKSKHCRALEVARGPDMFSLQNFCQIYYAM